ncbi:TPA: hypothetical protein ACJJ7H_001989 [Neisseria meningitidis]|uniref:hypothetical protein n=1 Tax=Neisseria meningitidis TaxID=487 RepID=UPI0025754808|nr:hypothetical protein [Neisseria meningitidis]
MPSETFFRRHSPSIKSVIQMMVQLGLLLQAGQHIKVLTDALSEGNPNCSRL